MYRFRNPGFGALSTPPANVQQALVNASVQYGVPLSLLQAVAQTESSYNPNAVSSAGAQGLMQIMPSNDASLNLSNPFDVQQSANAGAQMLAQLYQQYGNWNTALIAYNEGSGNLASQGVFPASQAYADTILSDAGMLGTMGPPALDSSSGDSAAGDSGLFNFSAADFSFTDSSGSFTPLAWAGVAVGALALFMVVQG